MLYDELYALCTSHLKDYRNDLEKHDREAIERNSGVPFIHWTRERGTHMTFLPPADTYPAFGLCVRYLFGTAGRDRILDDKDCSARHALDSYYGGPKGYLVHHFDGQRLRRITPEKALEIIQQYQRKIRDIWRHGNRGGADDLSVPHCYC